MKHLVSFSILRITWRLGPSVVISLRSSRNGSRSKSVNNLWNAMRPVNHC